VQALEDRLERVIAEASAGEFDGDEFGDGSVFSSCTVQMLIVSLTLSSPY
jgi:hypothetical protein